MKNWRILSEQKTPDNFDEIILELLRNRGIEKKEEIDLFLNPKLEDVNFKSVEIDKKNLKKAVDRVKEAIKKNEKIVIYGDYDVDGVCGTAILWEAIHHLYKNVIPFIPHRVEDGYGLSIKGIDNLLSTNPDVKLLITVDNGIVAADAVDYASKKSIDVIITDHHVIGKNLPDAFSIVHTTKLSGAGVAYMFSLALEGKEKIEKEKHLDLVALATVADLVPLVGPNRTLVKFGLQVLSKTERAGLLALFEIARIKKEKIGVYEVGYVIGPRLNATGRLASAMDSLRLVCTKDRTKAILYAGNLNKANRERQMLTEETAISAKSYFDKKNLLSKIIFVSDAEYNQGVIGLVAGKLVEEFYRPSFVVSIGEKYSKGSARSINGVNIIEMIRSVSECLVDAGGHPMAAGFTVETEKIEDFKKALEKIAEDLIGEELFKRTLTIDCELNFKDIKLDLYKKIQQLSPFGIGNFEPIFVSRNVIISDQRYVGSDGKHAKLLLSQEGFGTFDGIAFGMSERLKNFNIGDKIDVAYSIDLNEWNGNRILQLKVKDIKSTS